MNEPLRVGVVGAAGRMGTLARERISAADDLELVAEIGSTDELRQALRDTATEVALDVTAAGLGAAHGLEMLEAGVRPVIGTSGVTLEENEALDAAAREVRLGGLVVPNFSLGIWLLLRAAEEAARHFPRFEVVEMHHLAKLDAPSGTAIQTAERLAAVHGRDPADVPIHSIRLPGLLSNQEVMLGGDGEVLRLRHETYGLSCFGPGILAALRYARAAEGVGRGIEHAFEAAGD
ncbi:MAG: dihydrodipicolinate reductase C-terminal domain-containing protein [Planctomycetota bacterium]|nr:dihydrodipicolinate reductase C-terminal domain-containing protein [Planctomycetota bacterium]MDP6762317.1 dihydrodipicolinate reductase C-terminal domain-containing protein [Planctomycetota bacterium]MDP6989758.1 dihydrodipicolinate reductase C-terminal domain-containing protein [Planctomycetota bacterium]